VQLGTEEVERVVGIGVLKRNGTVEDFIVNKLLESLKRAGAPDPDLIVRSLDIKGTVTSSELSDKVQLLMLNLVTEDLKWHDAARNYLIWSVYKQVWVRMLLGQSTRAGLGLRMPIEVASSGGSRRGSS
jgi:hypothetical protein